MNSSHSNRTRIERSDRGERGSALLQVVVVSGILLGLIFMVRHRLDQQIHEMNIIKMQGLRELLVKYVAARTDCSYTLSKGSCNGSHALYDSNKVAYLSEATPMKKGPFTVSAQCRGMIIEIKTTTSSDPIPKTDVICKK